jgi:hypothetical protein
MNKNKWETVHVSLTCLAIVVSIIVVIRGCSQDKRIADLKYITNAVQFRPYLKLAEKPVVTCKLFPEIPRDLLSHKATDTVDIPATLSITSNIKLINTGNTIAHVFSIMWKDTIAGDVNIRNILTDKKKRANLIEIKPNENFFKTMDLSAGDTTIIKIDHDVAFIENDTFVLHFVFLYESEADALFDTYYQVRYALGNIIYKPEVVNIDGKPVLRFNFDKKQLHDFLVLVDDNTSTKTYSHQQSKDIIRFLTQYVNRKSKTNIKY